LAAAWTLPYFEPPARGTVSSSDAADFSEVPAAENGFADTPAEQFYSDGRTVNFNENAVAGQPAPKNPAPVRTLRPGTSEIGTAMAAAPSQISAPAWPGVTGLVVAVVALLIALANLVVLRRKG
jgi:hypothetical protein